MSSRRAAHVAALVGALATAGSWPTQAPARATGGTQAPAPQAAVTPVPGRTGGTAAAPPAQTVITQASASRAGGTQYGFPTSAAGRRPVISQLRVPRTARPGRPPRIAFRIDEQGVGTVSVRVTVTDLAARRMVITADQGWVHTARTVAVRWPAQATLGPGSYQVSISAHDHQGRTLLRRAHASGTASLTVRAPAPPPPPPAAPAPAPEPGVLTPAQTVAAGAVFPLLGPHSLGGAGGRFGASREGHVHQGQDIPTAEGTPVVAPLAGSVLTASYQAGGAGYYAVEHTGVGFDFMFAHCEAGSLAVSEGQSVSTGQRICLAGQTGDATGPHLHFEMWVGGWQAPTGHPIDPLPYLEAWERGR